MAIGNSSIRYMRRFTPTPTADGEWMIGFNSDELFDNDKYYDFRSSYHVLGARLLGMKYSDFLLYMAKKYNGILRGKRGYCHVTFKDNKDCMRACNEVEDAWKIVEEKLDLKVINRE